MQYLMDLEPGDVFEDHIPRRCFVVLSCTINDGMWEADVLMFGNYQNRRGILKGYRFRADHRIEHLSNCIDDGSL